MTTEILSHCIMETLLVVFEEVGEVEELFLAVCNRLCLARVEALAKLRMDLSERMYNGELDDPDQYLSLLVYTH